MKKLRFCPDFISLDKAHSGGGCLLPSSITWPVDEGGQGLLHLFTLPAEWVVSGTEGWLSVFTPFDLADTYLHWEELTADGRNHSVVIFHDNNGPSRNEYSKAVSEARRITLEHADEEDLYRGVCSKIGRPTVWLQDQETVVDHQCLITVSGEDIDIGFPEEPCIFSDGMVYVFLKHNFQLATRPSAQGLITFQFT